MQRRDLILIGAGALSGAIFTLAGCADAKPSASNRPLPPDVTRQLDRLAPTVREAYLFALERPEVLRWLPCYCGCDSSGHGSNLDCFVKPTTTNVIELDNHGAT